MFSILFCQTKLKSVDHLFKMFTFFCFFVSSSNIVTEYEGHALSLLKECELQGFDGYVAFFIYIYHRACY